MSTITEATPLAERPLIASLILVVQRENELRALYGAMGLTWGVDSPEDALASVEALVTILGASE